jgi:16S rRNA (cytosine1402-N4)-methyltransferase
METNKALEILKALNHQGKLYATDVDPLELPRTKERLEKQGFGEADVVIKKMNFAGIDLIVEEAGLLNFVLDYFMVD